MQNIKKQVIGILGGMGPQASAKLVQILVEMVSKNGAKEDSDFPEIILDSVPVPDFISSPKNINQVRKELKKRVINLNKIGVSRLVIACNTAHILLDDLQAVSKAPFISIIDSVVSRVDHAGIGRVGLLATPSTIRFGLFEDALTAKNIEIVLPTIKEQRKLEKIIRRVLAGKAGKLEQTELVLLADALKRRGAQGIILGCTELPLIFPEQFTIPIFNSLEILASASLRKLQEGNTI